jgi:uncharacterized protein (TIGR03790 family)
VTGKLVARVVELARAGAAHRWLSCTLAIVLSSANGALAQDGANVLVVLNTASPVSASIAARYARARAIPADNVVRLTTSSDETIDRSQYERQIERPIAEWIAGHAAQDRILYIVLIKGIPLRINGSTGRQGTMASVDSELTLLYRRLVGGRVPVSGPVANSYFAGTRSLTDSKPFSHADHDIYLVSRLDGFNEADVNGLIDRGAAPGRNGSFLLDSMAAATERVADRWLRAASAALVAAGYQGRVELDTAPAAVRNRRAVLGYVSWGSTDPALRTRRLGVGFAPGALATLLVSTDARTVKAPPDKWQPGAEAERAAFFEGSPQSLTADLIRDGVTGTAGYVAEPFLDGTIRPDVLFPAYIAGANLVESFYLATPSLGWQAVVFGDPLCAPFRNRALLPEETQPTLDGETELPIHFSQRRVAYLTSTGLSGVVVKLMLKGEGRRRNGDTAGTRQALEQATTLEPRLIAAHRILASVYEELGEHGLAIERYRRVLTDVPDDVLSLNNLAYALAVHQKAPADALPLAQKAHALSKGSVASITDTLGWIHYLLGQHLEAEKYLGEAATAAPNNADVQIHLAHVYVARGRNDLAARAIARSLQLDPALAERAEVKALRVRLGSR